MYTPVLLREASIGSDAMGTKGSQKQELETG
jgi:hypothetical protein